MNNSLIIKTPTLEEVSSISRFFSDSFNECFPEYSLAARRAYEATFTEETLIRRLQHGQGLLLTAWQQETLCGLISGTDCEGGVATVIWLFIEPAYQQQGIGKALFNAACEIYKEKQCHKIKLTAMTKKAKDYYCKLGMQQEGFHPNHWWGLDFWSLALPLHP